MNINKHLFSDNGQKPPAALKNIEEQLSKSETSLRTIFEITGTGFLLMDMEYIVIASNTVAEYWVKSLFSVPLCKGVNIRQVLLPDKLAGFDRTMELLKGGEHIHYESNFPEAEKELRWFAVTGQPVLEISGKVVGICFSVNNITGIKETEQEIKDLNNSLEKRVQERTAELTEANKSLEAFSYSISHDLRAPLRAVLSFTKLIQKEYGAKMEPRIRELFGHIIIYIKRMNTLVEDLLKFAKYGKVKLKSEPIDMTALVQHSWQDIQHDTPNNATFEMAPLQKIEADTSTITQVVSNLLSNAVKYSSKKAHPLITVWSKQTKEGVTYYFRDNGAGFDMKNHHRLFGAFQRLHGTSQFEGTGVGLAIVKRIIEQHGGTVGAESVINEGATFYFTIPVHKT